MTARLHQDQSQISPHLPSCNWGRVVRVLVVGIVAFMLFPGQRSNAAAQQMSLLMAETEARYHDVVSQTKRLSAPKPANDNIWSAGTDHKGIAPELTQVDLRVALLKFARDGDADTRLNVLAAQKPRGLTAISLTRGRVKLPELLKEARQAFPGSVGERGLNTPLIVEQGATLVLDQGDVLTLNRESGAFLVNFGRLEISGGGIVGAGFPNAAAPAFAPFVVTAGFGVMKAHDAYFANLGFGADLAFAGLSVLVNSFYQNEVRSALTGSVLRNVGSTVFVGGTGIDILGNRFLESRRTALLLRATIAARIHGNTFLDGAAGDAIRIAPHSYGTDIHDNEIFNPRESGIALLPGSADTTIRDVSVWHPRHHGIRAEHSDCLTIEGARILGARQEGVSLRASRGTVLSGSTIIASKRAGMLVADLPDEAVTQISRNRFAMNRIGVETAAPGQLDLRGNNFLDQFPRFLAGDVQFMTPDLLRDLTGKARIVLIGGGTTAALAADPTCPIIQEH